MRKQQKRVALIGLPILQSVNNLSNAAIARYAEGVGNWQFILSAESTVNAFRYLRTLDCDGAIVRVTTPAMRREALRVRCPVVNVSSWLENPGVVTVRHDYGTIGRQAAEHFLEKGYRRFGCVTSPGGWFIQARLNAFLETLRARGLKAANFVLRKGPASADEFTLHTMPIPDGERRRFGEWVRNLQPPAALMLTDDWDAPALMELCREAGLEIPRDLVVISTGVHSEIMPFCKPSLTAAQEDQLSQARMTIDTLTALMAGKAAAKSINEVPPLGIVERESTATMAIEDREVAHAVEFIRSHAGDGINVSDVIGRARISRVTLERHFREITGETMHDYIIHQKVRRVQELLLEKPQRSLQSIAKLCGFPDRRRLNQVFRRVAAKSPANWRRAQPGAQDLL
ncbi:MAG: substrate-binding domain-containing protein [Verrucomicrobiota bacterium]